MLLQKMMIFHDFPIKSQRFLVFLDMPTEKDDDFPNVSWCEVLKLGAPSQVRVLEEELRLARADPWLGDGDSGGISPKTVDS